MLLSFDFLCDLRKIKRRVKFPSEHYGKGEVLVYDVFPLTLISLMSISLVFSYNKANEGISVHAILQWMSSAGSWELFFL